MPYVKNAGRKLTKSQVAFCEEYVRSYNGVQSELAVNPGKGYNAAAAYASAMLSRPWVQEYIRKLERDIAIQAQLPKLKVLNEHKAIAFSNIADIYETWTRLKDMDELTREQKAAIAEIDRKTITKRGKDGVPVETTYLRIRMHDKIKSLESIAKLLGYNEAERHDIRAAVLNLTLKDAESIKLIEDE